MLSLICMLSTPPKLSHIKLYTACLSHRKFGSVVSLNASLPEYIENESSSSAGGAFFVKCLFSLFSLYRGSVSARGLRMMPMSTFTRSARIIYILLTGQKSIRMACLKHFSEYSFVLKTDYTSAGGHTLSRVLGLVLLICIFVLASCPLWLHSFCVRWTKIAQPAVVS